LVNYCIFHSSLFNDLTQEGDLNIPRQKKILELPHVYRGLATLFVVFFHTQSAISQKFESHYLLNFFKFGNAGVQFFFVLSGFIIYSVHAKDIGKASKYFTYLKKRIIRIYPAYIIITCLLAPFWFFVPSYGEPFHKDISTFIFSLFLIPNKNPPHLLVAWTLIYELIFYFVFSLFILHKKLGQTVSLIWLASVLFTCTINYWPDNNLHLVFFSPNNLLFAIGVLTAWTLKKYPHKIKLGLKSFFVFNLIFLINGLWKYPIHYGPYLNGYLSVLSTLIFGATSAGILLQSHNKKISHFLHNKKALLLMGEASYSIYLIHAAIISFLCKFILWTHINELVGGIFLFIIISAGATLGGIIFYHYIEKPLLLFFRKAWL